MNIHFLQDNYMFWFAGRPSPAPYARVYTAAAHLLNPQLHPIVDPIPCSFHIPSYCCCSSLLHSVTVFIARGEFFSEDVSIGEAVREIFLMCLRNSMSLEAISLPQRGSAEGVKLFCVLIGPIIWNCGRGQFLKFRSNRYK